MEENIIMVPGSGTKVIVRDVKQEIETAFLDYSMSVIVARALPDVRDGLKPVHRRILYTMHERGNDPQHPYRKSADTVGAVLGSYHPHGDASIGDALVIGIKHARAFIEQVRGVDSSSSVSGLLEKGLIEEAGRLDLPGRPVAFRTTDVFLRCFGLSSLEDLPPVRGTESESAQ